MASPHVHIALVKLRAPQNLDDETIDGIARTLSQLGRLGLVSTVVIDCTGDSECLAAGGANWRDLAAQQASRLVAAVDSNGITRARLVDNAISVSEDLSEGESFLSRGAARIAGRELLATPLSRGVITVVPAMGYTDESFVAVPVTANAILIALTRELRDSTHTVSSVVNPATFHSPSHPPHTILSIDRLIVLDSLGGIPSYDRPNGYHVFLNMEQEYENVKESLFWCGLPRSGRHFSEHHNNCGQMIWGIDSSIATTFKTDLAHLDTDQKQHLENLDLVQKVLAILPPNSSALLTTPEAAASSGKSKEPSFQASEVGTRRQRNPLIHNLLTDKPVFSSSLPIGRRRPSVTDLDDKAATPAARVTPTTFAKHGMPLKIFPDPKVTLWSPPEAGKPHLTLKESGIELPRLIHLIEDSFGRKLDVEGYLRRVEARIAGVIIAGDYEGGALLTWELPPGVADDGSPESRARMVPYLDKFAVLKKSQGSGGVADVVFKAMVRDCFPEGVCWRSRIDNPVNKWYFERSRGTWKLPGTAWAMFWTTRSLNMDQEIFHDYAGVCRGIVPTWIDNEAAMN